MGNEELGRHRGRKECLLCDAECESVSHVLWAMKSWAGIEEGRSVCCVMQSVRVLVMCCGQ